jgi:riboflavin kinase/FMN adenylyltransferase
MYHSDLPISASFCPGLPTRRGPCALTIGNFDGCHLGHQSLIRRTLELAASRGLTSASLTFWPRPDVFFHPERAESGSLFTEAMKTRAFHECGIDVHFTQTFDSEVSQMSPDQFFESILLERLQAAAVVVGQNFRFGKGRAGDVACLQLCGDRYGVTAEIKPFATHASETVSSTRIRSALRSGDVAAAATMLGRPYLLEGQLRRGDQIGRRIGFPTLNLVSEYQLLPASGVYAGYVWAKEVCAGDHSAVMSVPTDALPAAINVGVRPTVNGTSLRIEAHVLGDFSAQDFYDRPAGFYFAQRIRGEEKFPDLDALKHQILRDTDMAKSLLKK